LIPKNPASGLSVPEAKHAKEKREAFTDYDIKAIFGSEWRAYRERDAAKYWVPLLALYTGCRLEELCQLYTDDVQQVEGVWSLLIRAERHDQSVKTGENRTVPLHDAILKHGFIEYAQAQEKGRVFPKLKRVNHRYGHGLGQWFAKHKKNMGVNSPKKVFHSFRHTVPTRLKEAGVEDSLVAELLGHQMAGQTFGRYAKASSPRVLLDRAVSKLDFNID